MPDGMVSIHHDDFACELRPAPNDADICGFKHKGSEGNGTRECEHEEGGTEIFHGIGMLI